ncbi:MAG: hypothetical protein ACRCYU_12430 [Nocardioides sp.]
MNPDTTITDQLARALSPGDRDLILIPRGTVVAARERISNLEFEVSRLKGTLAMTHPAGGRIAVGDVVLVDGRDESESDSKGFVHAIGTDADGVYAEVEFADGGTEQFDLDDLVRVA